MSSEDELGRAPEVLICARDPAPGGEASMAVLMHASPITRSPPLEVLRRRRERKERPV